MLIDRMFLKWVHRWNKKIKHFVNTGKVVFPLSQERAQSPDEGPQKPWLKVVAKYTIWFIGRDRWWPVLTAGNVVVVLGEGFFFLAISYPIIFKRHLQLGSGQSQGSVFAQGHTITWFSHNRVSTAYIAHWAVSPCCQAEKVPWAKSNPPVSICGWTEDVHMTNDSCDPPKKSRWSRG